MANRQHGRAGRSSSRQASQPPPLEGPAPSPAPEPALHYIRCALSYQNQLLADIKALLEQVALGRTAEAPPAAGEANPQENLSKL